MTTISAPSHLAALKTFLIELRPTGADGFEGLMASVLTDITGIPFRLAASGSQFGSDGSAVREGDGVSFECKRYRDRIPRNEILSKIAELSLSSESVDAWFLCATSEVSAQTARDVGRHGREFGIGAVVLDWAGVLPRLAVAVAMSTRATRRSFGADASVSAAVEAIRRGSDFDACAEQLRRELREPLIGTEVARRRNTVWLTAAFSSRKTATREFGEPLSPLDEANGLARERVDLIAEIQPFLTGDATGRILCVLGGEGAGKSWLVAHAWSRADPRPLMVVLSPRDCQALTGLDECQELLASRLPVQTGSPNSEPVVSGWRRKLTRWRNDSRSDLARCPRVVVVIDGVNQRPQTDWGRVVEWFGGALARIGGQLIVTARTAYFETTLRPRLLTAVQELTVPDWTAAERDVILADTGINPAALEHIQDADAPVGRALRNPRLLGIAVRLLKGRVVEHIEELSVNHLLFEHLRSRQLESRSPEPVHECVARLRLHAQEVLSRIRNGVSDDVAVFDAQDVESVADGRYFVPVHDDPTRYALQDDGLVIALGFVVIDRLRTALRNGRDLCAELDAVIDPIAALDQAAGVVMAALTCACIDDTQRDDIAVALLRAFSEFQNPNHEEMEAFKSLSRTRSMAFLEAARHLCLTGWNQPNVDWIEAALVSSKANDDVRRNVQIAVAGWLRCYSLEPSVGVRGEVSAEERAKRTERINDDLQSLSSAEKQLLEGMEKTAGDIAALTRLAFTLMSGGPVAPFAKDIVRWCLANMLNQKGWPYEGFQYVVRLNRVDWGAARAALLKEGGVFRRADASRVGTWALIVLLEATGEPGDAREAEELRSKVSDFKPRSWRLVEEYCSSDPCDPSASRPINVVDTAHRYATLDATSLYTGSHRGPDELFLEMARPGVVRFEAEVGLNKFREFAEDVVERRGLRLKRGVFFLRPHSALLTRELALALATECEERFGAASEFSESDRWGMSQYQLLLAFPMLSAEEQLKAMLGTTAGEDVLRSLLSVMKPLDETVFERHLEGACQENDARRQYFLLTFAKGSGTRPFQRSRDLVASLLPSKSALVRMVVLEGIFHLRDEKLMRLVVEGEWRAEKGEERNSYENAYGSAILVEGALRNWISVHEALERMSPGQYGWAAKRLGTRAGREVARLLDPSIRAAVDVRVENTRPEVEYRCRHEDQPDSFPYRLSEQENESRDVGEMWKQLSESDEALESRQRRRQEAFDAFRKKLEQENAGILIDDIAKEEFEAIVVAAPEAADRWYRLFLELTGGARRAVQNLVLMLAYALRKRDAGRTVALLRAVHQEEGLIRFTVDRARIPLEAVVAWSAASSEAGREWCHERLDLARNDHELATEVLAALSSGEEAALNVFVRERLERGEPEGIARALLVTGFSNQQDRNKEAISRYRDARGFIGGAYRAAKYAHDRNGWSRHWFEEMCKADRPTEFWRYSILFTKIVDGRFMIWASEHTRREGPMRLFASSIDDEIDRRIEKWRKHREKTLFGAKKPADAFLPSGKIGSA